MNTTNTPLIDTKSLQTKRERENTLPVGEKRQADIRRRKNEKWLRSREKNNEEKNGGKYSGRSETRKSNKLKKVYCRLVTSLLDFKS